MSYRLRPREKRALVLGAAAMSVLLVVGHVVPAFRELSAQSRTDATELEAELRRAEAAVRQRRAIRDSLTARQQRLATVSAEMLLEGTSHPAAAAELAEVMSQTAEETGIVLGTIQPRTDTGTTAGVQRVEVVVEGTGDVEGVLYLLATLDALSPLTAVTSLSVTQPNPAAGDSDVEALSIRLSVQALARVSTEPDAGRARAVHP